MDDWYAVRPAHGPITATVSVPGSKSMTNRALLLAALAEGPSRIEGALFSDDSRYFIDSLRRLAFTVDADDAASAVTVHGRGGQIPASSAALYVGNAGTAARFLTAFLPLGRGEYLVDGSTRMRQRPIGALLDALGALGADVRTVNGDGCPPVEVHAAGLPGGDSSVDAARSGQFLSALLMVAPYARDTVRLSVAGRLASPPYIDMTLSMMAAWGVDVERAAGSFVVRAGRYRPRTYAVPPDASAASYFLAAAAATGGTVRVRNLALAAEQGDLAFVDVLARMGCRVRHLGSDIEVSGPTVLDGIDLDMNALSDMTMTLAAIAPFARGPVTIRNVGHIREQETDRLAATANELRRLGADVDAWEDGLSIRPSDLHGARIRTYDDHRMAMAFAIAGLRVPGVEIENPGCVAKTFPHFFSRLEAACAGA